MKPTEISFVTKKITLHYDGKPYECQRSFPVERREPLCYIERNKIMLDGQPILRRYE